MPDPARALGSEWVGQLAATGRKRQRTRNTALFHQGDPATAIFCLLEGRVRLDRHLENGRVATVAVVRGPALVAEASLFSDHYRCGAVTETDCVLSRVSKSSVLERLERESALSLALIRSLASDVRELRTRLELRNIRPASERLLLYLDLQAGHGGPSGNRPLAAIATELGLTSEALYRIVARLEKEGRVRREGRRLLPIART